jgi:uncharacterized iron-regulated membrane protein
MVSRKRLGLTLVELLVAISLCVMMIGAITGVLASLIQQQKNRLIVSKSHWVANFHRTLWTDLSHAQWIARLDEGMELSLADGSAIVYTTRLDETGKRALERKSYELREAVSPGQVPLSLNKAKPKESQTIFWEVTSIEFFRGDSMGEIQPIPTTWSPAPTLVLYRLTRSIDQPVAEHRIVVR